MKKIRFTILLLFITKFAFAQPTTQASSLTIASTSENQFTINWTNGNGSSRIVVIGTSSTPFVPTSSTTYASISDFSYATDLGLGYKCVYNGIGNSVTVTGLSSGTSYTVQVFEYIGNTGAEIYNTSTSSTNLKTVSTLESQPTNHASALTFSNITTNSMTVNITAGNGSSRILVAFDGIINFAPVDGDSYTANGNFSTTINQSGNGKIIGIGAGPFNITGLSANTTYNFKVFEFNGTAGTENYLTSGTPLSDSKRTAANAPGNQVTSINFSNITTNSMTVSWTNGSGDNRLVLVHEGSLVDASPTNFISYTASSNWTSKGSQIGTSNYVAYVGSGNTVTLSNLNPSTTYYVQVFEFSGTAGTGLENYNTTTNGTNPKSQTTLCMPPTNQATNLTFGTTYAQSMDLNWTRGNGTGGVIILMRAGSPVGSNLPVSGNTYSDGGRVFGSGTPFTETGNSNFVVYVGTGTSANITGLTGGTTYHVAIMEYNSTGICYNVSTPLTGNKTTPSSQSNIIADGTFNYPQNIDYISHQETDLTSLTGVNVGQFIIQDGGNSQIDADNSSTKLTSITLSITNPSFVRQLAIYDGNTEIQELTVNSNSSVTFTGLNLTAPDNSTKVFTLKASFNTSVTDNEQISFTITSATADTNTSIFAATNAGGAATSIVGDNNRIEVAASKLRFIQQPTDTYKSAVMSPAVTVEAVDTNGNKDVDYTQTVSITSTGTLNNSPNSVAFDAGVGTYSNIIHKAVGIDLKLTGAKSGVTSVESNIFQILPTSTSSNIIANSGFTYPQNINYITHQETDLTSSNGVNVGQFIIQDGGNARSDLDNLPTDLTSLTFSINNPSYIRQLAIYDGTTEIQELTVNNNNTITFSGFSLTALDNSTKIFTLKASFNTSVTDNEQFSFSITSATASSDYSTFENSNASGAITSTSGDDNKIEVVASQLKFYKQSSTDPSFPTTTYIYKIFTPKLGIKAIDGSENLDLDFNNSISSFWNYVNGSTTSSLGMQNAPTSSNKFTNGVFVFLPNFIFTTGNNTTGIKLYVSAGSLISQSSDTILVKYDTDSYVYADPNFIGQTFSDIPNQQAASLPITANATIANMAQFILSDGGAETYNNSPSNARIYDHPDKDSAFTEISNITFNISGTGVSAIRTLALYDKNGNKISADQTISSGTVTFTFTPPFRAPKNDDASFTIRGTFKSSASDQSKISFQVTSTTWSGGSEIKNIGGVLGGVTGGSRGFDNTIDVVATKFVFTKQPSAYAGVNEVIDVTTGGNTGIVEAVDVFDNVDTTFTYSKLTITADAQPTNTSTSFVNGVLNLSGMQYTKAALGTLTVSAQETTKAVTISGSSNRVDVINVSANNNTNNVTTLLNLKPGQTSTIFSVDIKADYSTISPPGPANEPSLKSLTFSFDKSYKTATYTAFTGFSISENGTSVAATITPKESVPSSGNFDLVLVTFPTYRPLYPVSGNPSGIRTYALSVSVSPTANSSIGKLAPQLIDNGVKDESISITKGSAKANVRGVSYGFATTNPPDLVGAKCTPYVGQLNVSPDISEIELVFNINVLTFDGKAKLYDRTTNSFVAELTATNGVFVPGTSATTDFSSFAVSSIHFSIPSGTNLQHNHVYYVTIEKGSFAPGFNDNGKIGKGTGISDDQLNLFGGISSNADFYFKIISDAAPKMIATNSLQYKVNSKIASLNASFDQKGKVYYLILDHSKYTQQPTTSQIKNPSTYPATAAVIANDTTTIDRLAPDYQFFMTSPNNPASEFTGGVTYDVWICAENEGEIPYTKISDPYGSANNKFQEGTTGPTFSFTYPKNNGIPLYQICPGTFTTLSQPIILTESEASKWTSIGKEQDFNILLPTGYEFDVATKPTVQLLGSDFYKPTPSATPTATLEYINNTLLNIKFRNDGTNQLVPDQIIISNLRIKTNSSTGDIKKIIRFSGNGLVDILSGTDLAQISPLNINAPTFTNSFTNTIAPYLSALNFNGVATNIPDNFNSAGVAASGSVNTVQLIPMITQSNDYYASKFSGNGITNDVLSLSVTKNASFKITMEHNNQNGCPLSSSENYLVYDHTKMLPKLTNSNTLSPSSNANHIIKIGLRNDKYVKPSDVQTRKGTNAGKAQSINPASPFTYRDIAGYEMDSLIVRIPLEATAKGTGHTTDQIIFDTNTNTKWAEQLDKLLTRSNCCSQPYTYAPYVKFFQNYTWDYSHILNANQESSGVIPDPYSHFISKTPGGHDYYTGGSLGFINYIGRFRSTADNTLYQPFIQPVELFVPAIPVIETTGQSYIISSPAATDSIYVFCELGADFQLKGYPQVIPGRSKGSFKLFDASSNASLNASSGFIDGSNGTATISPKNADASLKHKTIRVEYTYQDDNSPIEGVGKFYFLIAPNPEARFIKTSIGVNASNLTAMCVNNEIDFDASTSTLLNSNPASSISSYSWNFGDPNSGNSNTFTSPNTTTPILSNKAKHKFAVSSTYPVSLTIVSSYGCTSQASIQNVTVGEIPIPNFTFTGNCVGDYLRLDASASTMPSGVSSNSLIEIYRWNYNAPSTTPPPTEFRAPITSTSTTYSKPGFYNVQLTTISKLGCQNTITKPISQLAKVSAFSNNFDADNGEWQSLDLTNNPPVPSTDSNSKSSWVWGQTTTKNNSLFNSPGGNKLWSLSGNSGSYYPFEKSALYSSCLDINIPRPMISFSSFVDVKTGDGLVLQYSTDDKNILDPTKVWTNLGTVASGNSPGIDWFDAVGLPSNPGSNTSNAIGTGWTGSGKKWIHPKHKLDFLANQKTILRFAFSSLSSTNASDGVGIDSLFFGSRTRTILFENFATTDGGDTQLNTNLKLNADAIADFNARNINSTQVVNINYHIGFEGKDPFNFDNPEDPSSRALYYNVSKVPYSFLDAKRPTNVSNSDLFGSWGQAAYDLQTLQLAHADLTETTVTNKTDGSMEVHVKVKPLQNLPATTKLYVAILEPKVLLTNLPNPLLGGSKISTKESQFEYVLKKMLPSAVGTSFPKGTFNQSNTAVDLGKYTWYPTRFYSNEYSVVVFLQDEVSKEVYQSELNPGLSPPNNYTLPTLITGSEPIDAESVNIYPNPANNELILELPKELSTDATVTLVDQMGRTLDGGRIAAGSKNKHLNTHDWAAGVYIVQIKSDSGDMIRKKLVIIH